MSIQQTPSVEETRQVLEAYAAEHDASFLAPDAVFHDVASGNDHVGREAIAGMLHYVYHVAFEARAEEVRTVVAEQAREDENQGHREKEQPAEDHQAGAVFHGEDDVSHLLR